MMGDNQTLLQSLVGKTCIVTGGTSGIGKETVTGLARLHADVTIIGRSKEKCEAVTNEIISSTNNKNIRYLLADLSSMYAVRRLADSIVASNSPIDILINDAGGIFSRYALTEDGFESTIALNYLSPFLLTRLLLSNIRKSGSAKIINVGSSVHKSGRSGFDFKFPGKYRAMKAYATSKLMITMFTYSLARRLKGTGNSSILVEPGFVSTNLGRNSGSSLLSASFRVMKPFQISAHEAAKTLVYLSTYETSEDLNGNCYSRLKPIQTSSISYDEKLQENLWSMTSSALGLPTDIS
ncbi:MAG: SDR family oxidoreductase [Candidatus Thermoplasmatota archaeon]|nr:SDR family oxidoreductase [Candidatus Thermoplasmatota archaeon]